LDLANFEVPDSTANWAAKDTESNDASTAVVSDDDIDDSDVGVDSELNY